MPIHLCLVNILTRLVSEHPVLLSISIVLIFAFLGLLALTLLHNLLILRKERRHELYEKNVQDYLSELVTSTFDSATLRMETNVSLYPQPELKKKFLFNPTCRQILRREIKVLHKSVEGLAAKQLRTTYLTLGFLEECVDQLQKGDAIQQAEAITEFEEMEIFSIVNEIEPFLKSEYPELRILAQTFFAKISDTPLSFLTDYPFTLSKWDKIELVTILRKRKMDKLPGLMALFSSPNPSVREFALMTTTELQLTSYYSALIPALDDEEESVRLEAVKQLKKWHHTAALRALEAAELSKKSEKESKLITQAIEHLKHKIFSQDPLSRFLSSSINVSK